MKLILRLTLIVGFLYALVPSVYAQTAQPEAIDSQTLSMQITEIAHISPTVRSFQHLYVLQIFGKQCSELKSKVQDFCKLTAKNFELGFRKNLAEKSFFKPFRDAYQKHFSISELQQIYVFYASPLATKMKDALSGILSDNSGLELAIIGGEAFGSAIKSSEKEMGISLIQLNEANR